MNSSLVVVNPPLSTVTVQSPARYPEETCFNFVLTNQFFSQIFIAMQDLQLIGIHTRGHRMRLLRDIRKIPRLDIEEDIPVSFLMTYMISKGINRDRIHNYPYSFDIKPKAHARRICVQK